MTKNFNSYWPDWQIDSLLGRGNFGTVYKIKREIFGTTEYAALKVISVPRNDSDLNELYYSGYSEEEVADILQEQLQSITAEYNLTRSMSGNSYIVNCEDMRVAPHENGIGWDVFIKMELLSDLRVGLPTVIREEDAIQVGRDICHALLLCQKHNILHRDIKPNNIFISPNGNYKLGDFGIAKIIEQTSAGTRAGDDPYMAPEVFHCQPYGIPADIYSLGLVMYWMLNERRLPFFPLPPEKPTFEKESLAHRLLHSGEPIPPPKHGNESLKRIVLKACDPAPERRYQNAAEMLHDLNALSGTSSTIPHASDDHQLSESDTIKSENDVTEKKPPEKQPSKNALPVPNPDIVDLDEETSVPLNRNRNISMILIGMILVGIIVTLAILLLVQFNSGPPKQLEWSEWMDVLPEYTTDEYYNIEEQTLYRSRDLETTFSTTQSEMTGWELYDTVKNNDEFGAWSDWSASKVEASATREVENQTRYRYRDKETTTSASSSMAEWELYDTTYSWDDYGSWSSWSATAVSDNDSRQVETKTKYRYRNKEVTTGSSEDMNGWTLYDTTYSWGDYGPWSSWSTSAVSNSESRKVETKTQYRYRDISYSTEYTNWSSWSDWQLDAISEDDCTKVETRDAYRWYCYYCSSCGASMPYTSGASYSECYTSLGGCGKSGSSYRTSGSDIIYLLSAPSDGTWAIYNKQCVVADGKKWYISSGDSAVLQYRYANRSTQQVANYGSWSNWEDTAYSNSSSREVQTRTVYRYCDRSQVATYHFYRWDSWSDWSDNEMASTNDCQVETSTAYRYRDRSQIATYHFYRWGNWSDWSTEKTSATNDRQVEDTTYYRYRDRISTTTYYFQRWTDWTEYSDSVVTSSETVEVQTKTQYRYKSKES